MKLKLVLITVVSIITSTGCTSSQAQQNVEAVNIQATNESATAVTMPATPAPTLAPVGDISKSSVESTSKYQCEGVNNHLFLGMYHPE